VATWYAPDGNWYVIVDVPAATADTTPLKVSTVATAISELLQVPPSEPLLSVEVAPAHMLSVPVIAGSEPTVNVLVI
jgi:hypothetical protein